MRFRVSLAAICAVCFTVSASAHHSHGNYEDAFMDIEGVVKEIHLLVPHSWVYIEVTDANGVAAMWALEAGGGPGLIKQGVTREYIKPGDKIKARCSRLRDGNNGCLLGFLKAKDGSIKNWEGVAEAKDVVLKDF